MSSIPSPGPIHIIVHTAPAEWWEIVAALGPWVVLFGATIAACIMLNADRRRTLKRIQELDERAKSGGI